MAEVAKDRTLESHEVERINRIEIAKYFGVLPHQVDEMPAVDYHDVIHVLNARGKISQFNAQRRKQFSQLSGL